MSIEKINAVNTSNTYKPAVSENKSKQISEPDKELSNKSKLMIGATILAGTIAIGIIGHKNNWWRKAAKEGENLASSVTEHNTPPQVNPVQTEIVEETALHQISPEERVIAKVESMFSKEMKHARRALKQYNEIMDMVLETNRSYGGNYMKYLEAKGYTLRNGEKGIEVLDTNGTKLQVLHNFDKEGRLSSPAYIDFYKDNILQKTVTVSFANKQSLPMMFFYDKSGHITKRITNVVALGSQAHKPQIFVTHLKNGRVTKEAIYIQPDGEGLNGDYSTSQVFNIAKYSKNKIFETCKLIPGDAPKCVLVNGEYYIIRPNNILEEANIGKLSINSRRAYVFNKDNQIIECKDIGSDFYRYKAIDAFTRKEVHHLAENKGQIEVYLETDPITGQKKRQIIDLEENEHPECYSDIPYINGKADRQSISYIPKNGLNEDAFYEHFKADYAPDEVITSR